MDATTGYENSLQLDMRSFGAALSLDSMHGPSHQPPPSLSAEAQSMSRGWEDDLFRLDMRSNSFAAPPTTSRLSLSPGSLNSAPHTHSHTQGQQGYHEGYQQGHMDSWLTGATAATESAASFQSSQLAGVGRSPSQQGGPGSQQQGLQGSGRYYSPRSHPAADSSLSFHNAEFQSPQRGGHLDQFGPCGETMPVMPPGLAPGLAPAAGHGLSHEQAVALMMHREQAQQQHSDDFFYRLSQSQGAQQGQGGAGFFDEGTLDMDDILLEAQSKDDLDD